MQTHGPFFCIYLHAGLLTVMDAWAAFTSTQSCFSQSRQWKQKTQFDDAVKRHGIMGQSPLLMKIYPVSLSVTLFLFTFADFLSPSLTYQLMFPVFPQRFTATGEQMNNTVTTSKLVDLSLVIFRHFKMETSHILFLNEGSDLTLGQLIMTRQLLP